MRASIVLGVAVIALNDRRAVRRYSDVLVNSLPDGVRNNIQTKSGALRRESCRRPCGGEEREWSDPDYLASIRPYAEQITLTEAQESFARAKGNGAVSIRCVDGLARADSLDQIVLAG